MQLPTHHFRTYLYKILIKPLSLNSDDQRREWLVNIVLTILMAIVGLVFATSLLLRPGLMPPYNSLPAEGAFLFIMLVSLRTSRSGHYMRAAYIVVGLLGIATIQLLLNYGFVLPYTTLVYATVVLVSGILLGARAALTIIGFLSFIILAVTYAQMTDHLQPDLSWRTPGVETSDVIGVVLVLGMIGLVSWLANREIDRSLRRALRSEQALVAERDSLEIKVLERTRQLEETQLLRTMELQRFAEFGRLSANLLHEIANPLTAAALNLEQVRGGSQQQIKQAKLNIHQIERYVVAARKQLQQEASRVNFSITSELLQVMHLLRPLAKNHQIKLVLDQSGECYLYGDPVKFNQLLSNLVLNAIDAYDKTPSLGKQKKILIAVATSKTTVTICVTDWGAGIPKAQHEKIFEPFYTTKTDTNRGMGIGLAMVKSFVEDEFNGRISVVSSKATGTTFRVRLRRLADHK